MSWFLLMTTILIVAAPAAIAQENDWLRLAKRAEVLEHDGRYADALDCWREAEHAATKDGDRWTAIDGLAIDMGKLGRFLEAEQQYRRLLALIEAARSRQNPDYAVVLSNLAILHLENGDVAHGTAELGDALLIAEKVMPAGDVELAIMRCGFAATLIANKRYDDAEHLLSRALGVLETHPDVSREQVAIATSNLAAARQLLGRVTDAVPLFERAESLLEGEFGPAHPALLRVLTNLAVGYAETQRPADAERTFRRALAIAEQTLPPDHPLAGSVFGIYAEFLRRQGHKREARQMEARSKTALRESARRNGVGMIIDVSDFRK